MIADLFFISISAHLYCSHLLSQYYEVIPSLPVDSVFHLDIAPTFDLPSMCTLHVVVQFAVQYR